MRRGVLMTLLQQSAMTLPLWIGKPGDRYTQTHSQPCRERQTAILTNPFRSLAPPSSQPPTSVRRHTSQWRLRG